MLKGQLRLDAIVVVIDEQFRAAYTAASSELSNFP